MRSHSCDHPRPVIEAVLGTLLNDLGAISKDVVLVLDDYHVIEARDIHDGMAFLLERLPPQVHLVLSTRADPPLQLARWRGRGELLEIRAADLRFTPDEAADYLTGVMELELTAQDVAALERRTEGWITAIQLAALSMQGRDDIPASSRVSQATTVTSSTIWSKRCCSASPPIVAASYWKPPS